MNPPINPYASPQLLASDEDATPVAAADDIDQILMDLVRESSRSLPWLIGLMLALGLLFMLLVLASIMLSVRLGWPGFLVAGVAAVVLMLIFCLWQVRTAVLDLWCMPKIPELTALVRRTRNTLFAGTIVLVVAIVSQAFTFFVPAQRLAGDGMTNMHSVEAAEAGNRMRVEFTDGSKGSK